MRSERFKTDLCFLSFSDIANDGCIDIFTASLYSSFCNIYSIPIIKAALWPIGRIRLPQVKGTFSIQGLKAPVEVLRDRWGVPHIYARNARDVVFAQGFVHAQERLWQMDFTRRVVFGRLAEVLGVCGGG